MKTLSPLDHPEWLLSFDFDGTLANPDESQPVSLVEDEFFEVIQTMRISHRAYWGVNTGRTLTFILEGIAEARFPFLPDYIIAREREIYTPNDQGQWGAVLGWNTQCAEAHDRLFDRYRRFFKRVQKWIDSETGAVWGMQKSDPYGVVASTVSEMDWIVRWLNIELLEYPELSYQRNGIYLRFSHQSYHKGSAMAEVGRLIGVDATHTFAIGDSYNDLDMLTPELANRLACPGNACDEVKRRVGESGGYTAKNLASRGTVEALKEVFFLSNLAT